ncbi:hypothetical protein B9T38_05465 [Acinetobacter sp. ANC 4218]|uniref:phosphoribosyltransferase-like protein n=1 Tax=Acinetobacter sp. ANC 4218 TaxID=1977880 RepID=UPI000A349CBC|nr:hypothetical protein [Acinetobacter sp. ANC 4218]OTG73064.1 hypothetical protein B9T38_05465 [Acinetobacter sp. ANC 4218]
MQEYINNIVEKLKNYKGFYFPIITSGGELSPTALQQHVQTWLNQFEEHERFSLARITSDLLNKRYIEEHEEKKFIDSLFNNNGIKKDNLVATPLTIQRNGESQKVMVDYYKSVVAEKGYEYNPSVFIYLDDFMFSGGRVFNDLSNFISIIKKDMTIVVVVLGWHEYGQWYQSNRLEEKIREHNKNNNLNVEIEWLSIPAARMENRKSYMNCSDILWPMEETLNLSELASKKIENFSYRLGFVKNSTFDNNQDRLFLEKICLKYGFKIIEKCISPSTTTKPLGNSLYGYGFGGLVFNYRNCPNNTPIIFWWGSTNPFDPMSTQWYPLMPRRVY